MNRLAAALVLLFACLYAACGSSTGIARQDPAPTNTTAPTLVPTVTEVPPTATSTPVTQTTTCQPDDYSLYANQTTFITILVAGIPAPPQTKSGIGSSGTNTKFTSGGEVGICTIGTSASITAFFAAHLPALGWSNTAPPAAVVATCSSNGEGWSNVQWWKSHTLFSWSAGNNAGGGSIFWSYTFCQAGSTP